MKRYSVQITAKALADMDSIYDYIARTLQAPDAAMQQYDRIAEGIKSLRVFPMRCRLFDSQPENSLGMRQLRVDHYAAIYVVIGDQVTVLRVLYSSSDILSRLRNE